MNRWNERMSPILSRDIRFTDISIWVLSVSIPSHWQWLVHRRLTKIKISSISWHLFPLQFQLKIEFHVIKSLKLNSLRDFISIVIRGSFSSPSCPRQPFHFSSKIWLCGINNKMWFSIRTMRTGIQCNREVPYRTVHTNRPPASICFLRWIVLDRSALHSGSTCHRFEWYKWVSKWHRPVWLAPSHRHCPQACNIWWLVASIRLLSDTVVTLPPSPCPCTSFRSAIRSQLLRHSICARCEWIRQTIDFVYAHWRPIVAPHNSLSHCFRW